MSSLILFPMLTYPAQAKKQASFDKLQLFDHTTLKAFEILIHFKTAMAFFDNHMEGPHILLSKSMCGICGSVTDKRL